MDPTIKLIEIQKQEATISSKDYPRAWSSTRLEIPQLQKNIKTEQIEISNPVYCDLALYETLKEMKGIYSDPKYEYLRRQVNPFEDLGKSIFMNRASLKLVGVDALYNVSGIGLTSPLQPRVINEGRLTFCDICGGPGSHSQYLLWRHPQSFGYGITLREASLKGLDWDANFLKIHSGRFVPFYGYGNVRNGDLYVYWKQFSDFVRKQEPKGVELCVADGGFDLKSDEKFGKQEFVSSHLVLCEILTALKVLQVGGNFVCKIFASVTEISAQLIYLCALAFTSISIIKPIASRVANSERYMVCLGLKENVGALIFLLEEGANSYIKEKMVTQLFDAESSMHPDFKEWLMEQNDLSLQTQIEAGKQIIRLISNPEDPNFEGRKNEKKYYVPKAYTLWKIPLENKKKSYQISREPTTNY